MSLFRFFKNRGKDDLTKEIERYEMQPQFMAKAIYPEGYDQSKKFDEIMARHFPADAVRKNVSVSELAPYAHPACLPISYLIYKEGIPRVAVLLMPHKAHGGLNVNGTIDVCHALHIQPLNFYHEYENKAE